MRLRGNGNGHSKEHYEKCCHKACEGKGIFEGEFKRELCKLFLAHRACKLGYTCSNDTRELIIINKAQSYEGNDGNDRSYYDKGGSLAVLRVYLIGERSKEGKQEYGEDVVDRHYRARDRVGKTVVVKQNKRNDCVIRRPECGYDKERHSDEYRTLVVKLHKKSPYVE